MGRMDRGRHVCGDLVSFRADGGAAGAGECWVGWEVPIPLGTDCSPSALQAPSCKVSHFVTEFSPHFFTN